MSELREYYRKKADQLFTPNMVNDPEDSDYLLTLCKKLMIDNKVPWVEEDEDEWLEFVYRCIEIMELHENGHYYHHVKKEDGSWGHVLETIKVDDDVSQPREIES